MNPNLTFEPISRETVSSQIRSQLLRMVTTGELAPGTRIPSERALSEQFGVARTSVREALQGLVSLGVVERRGNRSYVAEHLPEIDIAGLDDRKGFVKELFETRRILEPEIFALAAGRADAAARARVAQLDSEFDAAMKVDEFRRLDRVFHTTIANACGNPLLTELYNKVLDRLFHSEGFASLLSDELNRSEVRAIVTTSVEAHHELAKAFAQADPSAMAKAAKDHVTSVEQRMLADLI